MNLTDLPLSEAAARLQSGELSPVELTRACLERIEQRNPTINAFITLTVESALQAAQQAETEIARGAYRGPLHGIPLALKDLFLTAGMPTTAGSRFTLSPSPSPEGGGESITPLPQGGGALSPLPVGEGLGVRGDAHIVQKLRAAGAVILGKLNMHEIALGVTNENPLFGDCCNPWNPAHITGGSSGGSAAALAAGMIFGALGSDTGGSIRIPSALCGVVGLKPTYGRVSLQGVIPLSWHLDHVGPMARSVKDAALLLQAVAGYDPGDPASANGPVEDYLAHLDDGVRGWRVALASDEFFTNPEAVDAEVLAAVQEAANVFAGLGARVEAVDFPNARDAALANGLMTTSDAAAFHRQRLAEQPDHFGADVRKRLQTGAAFTSTEYVLARRTQSELRRQFERFFESYDILLTPATPITAPRRGSADAVERARLLTRFTAPFNLTGLPALSLPCGFTAAGLPIGLQIVSRPWNEAGVLRAGQSYEHATRIDS
jgi:aspartyl-tRNA(Asn)/glutamyl-tRNA(Gln) amidotransferase subunit A